MNDNWRGKVISKISDVLSVGDIIAVSKINASKSSYKLQQIPEVNGSIVAIEPHTGKVVAMVGGYANDATEFNRAIQAKRQPGSAFKTFVYLAALENGFDPNSIIVDEEIKLYIGRNLPGWNPKNYSGKYYGPTTLRKGLEKSRNAMTVRIAQLMGIEKIVEISKRLNIYQNPDANFSMTLGAVETDLLSITNAYAILANGGKRIDPYLIDYVQNIEGEIIFKGDNRICKRCDLQDDFEDIRKVKTPYIKNIAEQIIDPIANYQITSILQGVIQRGTGFKSA